MKKYIWFLITIVVVVMGAVVIFVFDLDDKFSNSDANEETLPEVDFEVEVINPQRDVINPYSEISIYSTNELELQSGAKTTLLYVGRNDQEKHFYIAKVDEIVEGESSRKIVLKAKGTNSTKEIEVKFNRNAVLIPLGYDSIDGWPEFQYVLNPENILAIVDKKNRLPEDYEPKNLVDLNKEFGIYTFNEAKLTIDAGRDLKRMWEECGKQTGDYVTVASGYRSWSDQFAVYSGNVQTYGETETDKFSAKPGHSEHQTGTTIDITNKETNYSLDQSFDQTKAGKWLAENSYKFGYILTYTKELQAQTGINYEPWHFRYVGVENAKEFHESGLDFYTWVDQKEKV